MKLMFEHRKDGDWITINSDKSTVEFVKIGEPDIKFNKELCDAFKGSTGFLRVEIIDNCAVAGDTSDKRYKSVVNFLELRDKGELNERNP